MMSDVINQMVARFLSWPLPNDVCADPCAADPTYAHPRTGTNLLTADQARQMIEYLLADADGELDSADHAKIDAAWEKHKAAGYDRPAEPAHDKDVSYRGWEIGWNDMAAKWGGTGWDAYKGGCDLGAPRITTADFSDCLDEIDDYEDGEA
jgi:hypothetical protein